MKTRIFALLLAVICVLTLASCKKDTAASLYADATKAMEEANGYEANVSLKMTMEMAGETQNMDMDMSMKANGDSVYVSMDLDGIGSTTVTYVDGTMYMLAGDEKTKATVSLEDFKKDYGSMMTTTELPELSEEALKDVELVEDGDNRSFTVTLDAATMQTYVNELMGGVMGSSEDTDMPDFDIKSIVLTPTFDKDGNMIKANLKMEVSYEMDMIGEMKITMDMTMDFVNPGKAPTITAPADADAYVESDLF